jgi:hypothetical protein
MEYNKYIWFLPTLVGEEDPRISGVGVFFSRQDAGLLPAKLDSGNCLAFYCRLFNTFTPTRTDALFCLSRRQ